VTKNSIETRHLLLKNLKEEKKKRIAAEHEVARLSGVVKQLRRLPRLRDDANVGNRGMNRSARSMSLSTPPVGSSPPATLSTEEDEYSGDLGQEEESNDNSSTAFKQEHDDSSRDLDLINVSFYCPFKENSENTNIFDEADGPDDMLQEEIYPPRDYNFHGNESTSPHDCDIPLLSTEVVKNENSWRFTSPSDASTTHDEFFPSAASRKIVRTKKEAVITNLEAAVPEKLECVKKELLRDNLWNEDFSSPETEVNPKKEKGDNRTAKTTAPRNVNEKRNSLWSDTSTSPKTETMPKKGKAYINLVEVTVPRKMKTEATGGDRDGLKRKRDGITSSKKTKKIKWEEDPVPESPGDCYEASSLEFANAVAKIGHQSKRMFDLAGPPDAKKRKQ
jgi:hypothetical protein